MPLTAAHVRQFATEGFCIVPDFFGAREVAGFRAELDRFQREGMLRNVATEGDGKTHSSTVANLQICPLTGRSTFYRSLKYAPNVVDAVSRLIGDPVWFKLDQIFLKPGRHGAGTSWHQDNAYFNQPKPEMGTGMWVALHDANEANGTMRVIPRSHLRAAPHVRDPGSDHHIFAPDVDESQAVLVEVPAGGTLFFNWGILHCTKGNRTEKPRAGLALHFYNGDHGRPDLIHDGQVARITGPGASGGVTEYGVRVEGTFERELERVLAEAPATSGV